MTRPVPRDAAISVVLVVHDRVELTRACVDALRRTVRRFELCVVDNASTDGTRAYLGSWSGEPALRYRRNAENAGVIRALNQGAALARGERLCFLHNDAEMLDPHWLDKLAAAVGDGGRVGLAGLYGARQVRRDGTYVGRGIVHALAEAPAIRGPVVEVAAVDGVCLFVARTVLAEVGGFDEGYGFLHGYDRDLSFAVRATGRRCVVVDSRFRHQGGGTRTGPGAPVSPAADLAQRREAMARFLRKWGHMLPADARSRRERLAEGARARLAGGIQRLRRWTRPVVAPAGRKPPER